MLIRATSRLAASSGRRFCPARTASRMCASIFRRWSPNKCPVGPNRGYSRMQHLWFLERVMDICGHNSGFPPTKCACAITFARKNSRTPRPTAASTTPAITREMLKIAKKLIGWDKWKETQKEAAQGRPHDLESALAPRSIPAQIISARRASSIPTRRFPGNRRPRTSSSIFMAKWLCSLGSVPQGQGHETIASQVVAEVLDIPPEMVKVRPGFDSEQNVYTGHTGTYASQFAVTGAFRDSRRRRKIESAKWSRVAAFALEDARKESRIRSRRTGTGNSRSRNRKNPSTIGRSRIWST